MPRLLVLSASAGAGHNRAAEAVHEWARANSPSVDSEWVDSLKYTNRLFSKLYEKSYFWLASYAPDLWGALYKQLGKKKDPSPLDKAIELHDRLAYKKLMGHVEEFRPDAVVCTHFLPMNVLLAKRVGVPVYVVVTDYDVHSQWLNLRAAGYFVASEEVKVQLARYGYPAEKIRVTGIPIHPVFSQEPVAPPSDRPRVLLMGGGLGMGQMEGALSRILDLGPRFRLTVVAGKNEKMRKKLEAVSAGRAEVLGFVSTIHELMGRSDLIITKSGGLTVSECLARRLPMVLYSPIPGQEECNADFLLEHGCAVKARTLDLLDYKVLELLENPARLDMMKRACAAVARPWAGRDVLRHVLDENPPRG
jgi:processive 1,2-diacylglycerol beta-glucosyltransferase